nr:immunoglobulin heavy chain junction region [Macaca mulatta]MOX63708.1 immunoglobulin heavy chain junction region [Macaca mulatta]MOX68407.1 immunoglobulin heavy chain junction region [Macaca mulatta]
CVREERFGYSFDFW